MKTVPKITLIVLAAAMLAACGGGGDYSSSYEPSSGGEVTGSTGESVTANTSIGGITVSDLQDNGSVYREGQR